MESALPLTTLRNILRQHTPGHHARLSRLSDHLFPLRLRILCPVSPICPAANNVLYYHAHPIACIHLFIMSSLRTFKNTHHSHPAWLHKIPKDVIRKFDHNRAVYQV